MGIRLLAVVALSGALGCAANVGASTVPEVHASYNDALVHAQNAQLLLNLVRMRYRDTPYFVDVTSVTNQQSFAGTFGIGTDLGIAPSNAASTLHPAAGGSYSVTPTVVYMPLQGEAFVRRMVAPLSLFTVLTLSTAGWNTGVFRIAVDRINDVRNATSAAGPTPKNAPPYKEFLELMDAIRTLQNAGALELAPFKANDPDSCVVVVSADHDPQTIEAAHTLQRLLKIDAKGSYVLGPFLGTTEVNQIHFRMRSVLSALYYLSAAVETPPEHERDGLVTVTKNPDGSRFEWKDVFYKLFRVQTSENEPHFAFTKTYYRGYWFFIADSDLDTKSTFQLIAQLVSMQAGSTAMPAPLLTISTGH